MTIAKEITDMEGMREALIEAKRAFDMHEVPVGAVLVNQGKIIARGYNQVESKKDATAHAEMVCLKEAAKYLDAWRLSGCVLYTTLEPCFMCAGALALARVKRVVWGAPDHRYGIGELSPSSIHKVEYAGGVLEEESAKLLKTFFQLRRKENAG